METSIPINRNNFSTKAFHWTVAFLGVCTFLYSISNLPFSQLGLNFAFIFTLTIALGSRVAINFNVFKSSISVTDVFIYLVVILFGGEAACTLAAIEGYVTSSRFAKSNEYRTFNGGTACFSIFLSSKISIFAFGDLAELIKGGIDPKLAGAILVLIIGHYVVNTLFVSISISLRTEKSVFTTWREYYVWMIIPFLASGSIALIAANTIQNSGFYAFLIVLPIVGIIYFGYHSQQGKLEATTAQADQAKRHLIEMTESEARFRSAFSNAPIGIALMSNDGKWLQANESICKIFGCSEEEFLAKTMQDVVHAEDLVRVLKQIGFLIQGKQQSFQTEIRFHNADNQEIWTQTSISLLKDSENAKLICQIQDISARKIAEDKLRHDAFYDSLTDLANRTKLVNELNIAIAKSNISPNSHFVSIFVDLDRFKLINDSIGHGVGDKLLIAVSKRVKRCLPSGAIFARLGSDEFFILCEFNSDEITKTEELVKEIQSQIALEFSISGHQINITASLGIVFHDEIHHSPEDILRDTGTALHLAKVRGRSTYVFFDKQMREKANNQMQLEKDLQKAVERKELFLVYQPILELEDKKLVGFEALIRWQHPKLGLVPPFDFIQLAEENGTIIDIGNFVLEESCRQLKEWQWEFSQELPISISVNVSTKQLLHKKLFSNVVNALEKYKIKPYQLKLEITESVVVENSELVTSILRQFRSLGVKLSMDDFGTGYSSLSYLHQLPIDTLKIDRSFVSQMTDEVESAEIVRTILLLAKNLKLDVVAEGIETELQHEILKDLKCEYGQGYYFSRPLVVSDAKEFIENSTFKYTFVPVNNLENQSSFIEH
jgi:diguanylate cyclase (GGDEF)-like protein/PAS domain S-box-containing protein